MAEHREMLGLGPTLGRTQSGGKRDWVDRERGQSGGPGAEIRRSVRLKEGKRAEEEVGGSERGVGDLEGRQRGSPWGGKFLAHQSVQENLPEVAVLDTHLGRKLFLYCNTHTPMIHMK